LDPVPSEWLNLLLRWFHVFAAILWIGQTWLFTWFEAHFEPSSERSNLAGEHWMVHSGGFYKVEKHIAPPVLPRTATTGSCSEGSFSGASWPRNLCASVETR